MKKHFDTLFYKQIKAKLFTSSLLNAILSKHFMGNFNKTNAKTNKQKNTVLHKIITENKLNYINESTEWL